MIGSHVFSKGTNFVNEILKITDSLPIQVFLGDSNESVKTVTVPESMIYEHVKKHKINLFVHSRFIINMAKFHCPKDRNEFNQEYIIANAMGARGIVIHINGRNGIPNEDALRNFKAAIVQTLKNNKDAKTKILLETSSGHGQEMLSDVKEFLDFIQKFPKSYQDRLGICIDTCHIFAAGYDISTVEGVEDYFAHYLDDKNLIKKVELIHFNDSHYDCGTKKDRHAEFGYGYITRSDFQSVKKIMEIAKENKIPLVLERRQTDNQQEIFDLVSLW